MTKDERWNIAVSWVNEHSHKISGYVRNKYYLFYSSYELQDFMNEAYIVAYEALGIGKTFEGCFWNIFKNKCKTLANKPHASVFSDKIENLQQTKVCNATNHKLELQKLLPYMNILSKPQREIADLLTRKPLSIKEISINLGISIQAVRKWVKKISLLRE